MSEYQARKARMLELQREKEEDLKRELAAKAAKEKQLVKEAEELRKRQEIAAKEARRLELMRANEALNKMVNGGESKKEAEYDPFAEDARPAPSAVKPNTKPPLRSTNSKAGSSRSSTANNNSSSKQSVPGPSAKTISNTSRSHNHNHAKQQKAQSNSPPPLGRKERAAKAFAQSAKKSTNDSLFSIRSLVESREAGRDSPGSGSAPLSRNNSGGGPSSSGVYNGYKGSNMGSNNAVAVHGIGMSNGLKRDPNAQKIIPGKFPSKNTRENLKNQVKLEGLRQLCPDRATRDRRTIEEIQRDIKSKRVNVNSNGNSSKDVPKPKDKSPIRGKPALPSSSSIPKSPSLQNTQSSSKIPPRARLDDKQKSLKRRPPSSTSGSDSGSDSDSSSSSSSRRPRKKAFDPYNRRPSPPIRLNENSSHLDIRNEIQNLFRRPGAPVREYHDDFSDDDMEAGLSDVEEEERRTARIARREDELAEREEREHKMAKLKKKKELEKAKGKK